MPKAPEAPPAVEEKTEEKKPKRTNKKPPKEAPVERVVVYDKLSSRIFAGDKAATAADCKRLLGWEKAPDDAKEGVTTIAGERVFLTNNLKNRPIYSAVVETLKQEHLRRKWKFNGEPIIIGRTGLVLNAQHSMIALIEAVHEWHSNEKWKAYWDREPTMEKLAVFGVDEDDSTVNTMDTCKPRSLADVIYRSEYFAGYSARDRKNVAKRTSYAIAMLWERTGAKLDAYAPIRTHSESLDFLNRHRQLLAAVKHIYEEDGTDSKISKYLSPGYSSAMMYLMAASATERETDEKTGYSDVRSPSEAQIDFERWATAQDFWVLIAKGDTKVAPIRQALGDAIEGGYGTVGVRCALLVKAWLSYLDGGEVAEQDLSLEFSKDPDTGARTLTECPTVGGIDLGRPTI